MYKRQGRGKPRFRTAGLLSVILFLISLFSQTISVRDVTCCSILSSGDGISIVITRNGRAAVVGCAGYSETPVLQALDDRNMTSLDLLVMVGESFEEGSNAGHIAEKKTTQTLICLSLIHICCPCPRAHGVLWRERRPGGRYRIRRVCRCHVSRGEYLSLLHI